MIDLPKLSREPKQYKLAMLSKENQRLDRRLAMTRLLPFVFFSEVGIG